MDCNIQRAALRRQIEIEIYKESTNAVVSKLITIFLKPYYMCGNGKKGEEGYFDRRLKKQKHIHDQRNNDISSSYGSMKALLKLKSQYLLQLLHPNILRKS